MYQEVQVFFGLMNEFDSTNKTSKLANEQLQVLQMQSRRNKGEFLCLGIIQRKNNNR
jgi:hypothetical protein